LAGDKFHIHSINVNGVVTTIKSSNGDVIDTLGSLEVVSSSKGSIIIVALINAPTVSSDWLVFDIRESGTYTPTSTNIANVTAAGRQWPENVNFSRNGSTVTVSGKCRFQNSGAGTCNVGMTLPIFSVLGSLDNVAGQITTTTGDVLGTVYYHASNTVRAETQTPGGLKNWFFHYTYLVN
jgi:hypothetical protein